MIEQLDADLKQAMLARDAQRATVLRGLKASLMNERISKGGDLTEQDVITVLKREVKKREEARTMYEQAGRDEQAASEREEAAIISEYLPEQLSEDELIREAEGAIEETGAQGPQDMGKVMGVLSGKLQGRADNAQLAQIVKGLLTRD